MMPNVCILEASLAYRHPHCYKFLLFLLCLYRNGTFDLIAVIHDEQLKAVFAIYNHENILLNGGDKKAIVGIRSWQFHSLITARLRIMIFFFAG
jgi:hypothetical protein